MRPTHLLLALAVVAIWGVNFAIIKLGLREVSPLALGVWRFTLAVFPWIFFVKRPKAPIGLVIIYGLFIGVGQFGFLFTGMKIGMSAGLASLILQLQVFFTIGLSVLLLGERPAFWQLAGAVLAFGGVGIVALHVGGDVTLLGLVLLVAAAASWGGGNVVSKLISQQATAVSMLGLVVWGSLVALPPLAIVALLIDRGAFLASFVGLDWVSLGSIGLYRLFVDAVRLRRLEQPAWQLPGLDGGAVHLAGAGVRVPRFGRVARRAVTRLEARRVRPCRRRPLPEPVRSAPFQLAASMSWPASQPRIARLRVRPQ